MNSSPSRLLECIEGRDDYLKSIYSNSSDSDEFPRTWNVPASGNKSFPRFVNVLLDFKSRQVLLAHSLTFCLRMFHRCPRLGSNCV